MAGLPPNSCISWPVCFTESAGDVFRRDVITLQGDVRCERRQLYSEVPDSAVFRSVWLILARS